MKFCIQCGKGLPDDAAFCPSCGAKQPPQPVQTAGMRQEPPPLPPQPVFPPWPYTAPQALAAVPPVKKRGKLMAAAAALSLVLGIAAGGVIYYLVRILPLT